MDQTGSKLLIHFFFYTGIKKLIKGQEGPLPVEFEVLRRELKAVGQPIMQEMPPRQGLFIQSYKTGKFPSNAAKLFCWFSAITLNVFPCYSESSGWNIVYTFYQNGKSLKSYSYVIRKKQFVWMGAIPFSWMNYVFPQYEQAYSKTTQQFLLDLQKDGFLDG